MATGLVFLGLDLDLDFYQRLFSALDIRKIPPTLRGTKRAHTYQWKDTIQKKKETNDQNLTKFCRND